MGLFSKHKIYDEFTSITAEEAPEYCLGSERQKVHSRMAEIIGDDSVLDIGCGIGLSARHFNPKNYLGVDISEELIKEAKRRNPQHEFLTSEVTTFLEVSDHLYGKGYEEHMKQYNEPLYKYAILKAILEHQPSLEQALNIFYFALKECETLLVAWHMIPKDRTKIHKVKGHFGKKVFQNEYKATAFETDGYEIIKERVENYDLWQVKKI